MTPAPAKIRVLVVDDHQLLREGIAAVLGDEPDIAIVAEAEDGESATRLFAQHLPDITLMDVRLPNLNGIEALTAIRRMAPKARVIVLTTFAGDATAVAALKAGASGYLLK